MQLSTHSLNNGRSPGSNTRNFLKCPPFMVRICPLHTQSDLNDLDISVCLAVPCSKGLHQSKLCVLTNEYGAPLSARKAATVLFRSRLVNSGTGELDDFLNLISKGSQSPSRIRLFLEVLVGQCLKLQSNGRECSS